MTEEFRCFLNKVEKMRKKQKEYFSGKKTPNTLKEAKSLEKEVDDLLKLHLAPMLDV